MPNVLTTLTNACNWLRMHSNRRSKSLIGWEEVYIATPTYTDVLVIELVNYAMIHCMVSYRENTCTKFRRHYSNRFFPTSILVHNSKFGIIAITQKVIVRFWNRLARFCVYVFPLLCENLRFLHVLLKEWSAATYKYVLVHFSVCPITSRGEVRGIISLNRDSLQ